MKSTPRRNSAILWTVNLASIGASVFSYVYLSYFVYVKSGSVLLAEAVLVAPMVIPALLCLMINRVAGGNAPRRVLLLANGGGIVLSLVVYAGVESWPMLALLGALLIGFADAVQRVARTVAIKRYFSAADVKYALPITLTAQFIAGALAGVALSSYKADITPTIAGAITVAGFGMAAAAASLLPRLTSAGSGVAGPGPVPQDPGALASLLRLLGDNPELRRSFLEFFVVVSVLQGFFNVSRVTLPTHVLQLPQIYVGYLQIIGASAALAAALAFMQLGRMKVVPGRLAVALLAAACLAAMIGSTSARGVQASYALYGVYMFLWEMLFFKYQSDLVDATPVEHMGLVATFQYASVYAGMLATGLAGGLLTEHAGLPVTAIGFAMLYVVAMLGFAVGSGRPSTRRARLGPRAAKS